MERALCHLHFLRPNNYHLTSTDAFFGRPYRFSLAALLILVICCRNPNCERKQNFSTIMKFQTLPTEHRSRRAKAYFQSHEPDGGVVRLNIPNGSQMNAGMNSNAVYACERVIYFLFILRFAQPLFGQTIEIWGDCPFWHILLINSIDPHLNHIDAIEASIRRCGCPTFIWHVCNNAQLYIIPSIIR